MSINEIIQLISVIIIGIGVIIGLKQLRDQHKWYRREKALSYSNLYHPELQKTKLILEENFNIVTRKDPIPTEDIKDKIENDKNLKLQLNYLLTYYENLSLACFKNIADEGVLFDLMAGTLVSFRKKLMNYIDFRREESNNPKLWENFEMLSLRWEKRIAGPISHKEPPLGIFGWKKK